MSSIIKSSLSVSFGDTVRLKDSRIGKVRFIGRTTVKKAIYYGIHLKQDNGNNDGTIHNRRYFKCPPNRGTFVKKSSITEVIKKHTISASFHYNQQVMVNDISVGTIKYIGWTHFGNDYWYGIELETALQNSEIIADLSNNNHMHLLSNSDYNNFRYFDYSDENKSIFARQTQIKCANNREFRRREVQFAKLKPPKIRFKMDEKEQKDDTNHSDYINETLLSMMDSLNIKKSQRKKLLAMDNANKLLLIEQWFITPNAIDLQKTIRNNSRKKKKSRAHSLVLLRKKSKPKQQISTPTPMLKGSITPSQSCVTNLDFDGCDIAVLKDKKQKKSVKSKRKKSKSKSLALLGINASQELNRNKKVKRESNVRFDKSKSTSSLHRKGKVKDGKQKKNMKEYKQRVRNHNHAKSDALLLTKSEKYKSKKSKSNKKKKRKTKELSDMSNDSNKLKYKRTGSAGSLLSVKEQRKSVKRRASSKSLKRKSKKLKRKSWQHVDNKLID